MSGLLYWLTASARRDRIAADAASFTPIGVILLLVHRRHDPLASRPRNVLLATVTRIGVIVALLAIAVSVYVLLVRTRKEPAMTDPSAALPRIAVIEVASIPISRQWQGFGTAAPAQGRAADVPAQVRGLVETVPPGIVPGATVEQGEVLVQLDASDYRSEVEATQHRIAEIEGQIAQLAVEFRSWVDRLELAQEEVKIAESDLDRILVAQERGSATQREVDQLRSALIAARRAEVQVREQLDRIEPRQRQLEAVKSQQETALRLAERHLERCTITSPIAGIIQAVDVEHGEIVRTDQRVARVVDLRRIEVPLRLPAAARSTVTRGDEVVMQSAGASDREWLGTIQRISPEDDQSSRTIAVYVEIEQDADAADVLTPGTFVQAVVNSSDVRERVILPRRAVHGGRVWVVDQEGVLRSSRVDVHFSVRGTFPQFGIADQAWVAVADGLHDGSMIVLDGARSLVEGSRIDPVLPGRDDSTGLSVRRDGRRSGESDSERVP